MIFFFFYSQEEKITIKAKSDLPHLRDPNLIKDNDLTSLNYLNEPEGKFFFFSLF